MEHVVRVDSRLALLLVAEYQIDPFVQVSRYVVGLESHAMHAHKLSRVVFGPWRQHHVVQFDAVLFFAQVEFVGIEQKFGQFFDVGHVVFGGREPRVLHTVKHAIGQVKVSALQLQKNLRERLHAHKIGGDDHGRRVVGAVVIGRRFGARVLPLGESLVELAESVGTLGAHRLGQVAECVRRAEVKFAGLVVAENPRKDGILH
ncbi:hypothetical protein BpHYR1_005995 [Brachionus plicatilis]|uniref:Uncharacterized protein n=1 Tax=Brachionus plicatilis TaxID=10195 RepID=A0A3M7SWA5_BRAPC|nr:hypothetical protein BpHYR1_005995 [Brachionus plicatilis]